MANGNGTTAKWIAIIVMVIITMASLAFGVIRTSNSDKIDALQKRVNRYEEIIIQMRESRVRTEIQVENIQGQLNELNKKMDILIDKLGK